MNSNGMEIVPGVWPGLVTIWTDTSPTVITRPSVPSFSGP
jgi:hypothetical protein